MVDKNRIIRCSWCLVDDLYINYHDKEWGSPLHDDKKLFEFLILEGAQAGLSWLTILKRREGYKNAFNNFDFNAIAKYNDVKISELMQDTEIVRNKLKILSVVRNAKSTLALINEFGSLDKYFWSYTNQSTIDMHDRELDGVNIANDVSRLMSQDLKKRGFNFIGPTICYAFIQAVGIINDHQIDCFRYTELIKLK